MSFSKLFLFLIIGASSLSDLSAQSEIALGEWQSHLPYQRSNRVTQSAEKAYYATDESIFILDKEDKTIDFLTKIEGLSETGIQNLLFDEVNNQLIVAYFNGVFDIVTPDDVFRVSDIKDKSEIQGDKLIYDMYIQDGQLLYLATGFGLVQFDLGTFEFGFTMDLSQRVEKVDGEGNEVMILLAEDNSLDTPEGIYALDVNSTNAPGFFQEWQKLEAGLPQDSVIVDIYAQGNKKYVVTQSEVYLSQAGGPFTSIYQSAFTQFDNIFIKPYPEGWILGMTNENPSRGKGKVLLFDNEDNRTETISSCMRNLQDAVVDEAGGVFFCDIWRGISYLESLDGPCNELEINSPFARSASHIAIQDNQVYITSGGVRENFGDEFSQGGGTDGIYILAESEWSNINNLSTPFIKDNSFHQIYKVAASPEGDKVYFASFWAGLGRYDVETQQMDTLFNTENSPLENQVGDQRVRLSGLAFDADNTLWISNFGAPEPLVALSEEGTWHSFPIRNADDKLTNIDVDDTGLIWITIGGTSGGLVVYDPGEDLADPTDDRQRYLNQNNSEIPSNFVNTVKVDNEGAVWVGTGTGVVVFECGTSALDESCIGTKRKVLQDIDVAFLLATEDVLSIAVDGANRKWFGTRNGIFVQSADGEEQIAKFDADNSPLFDNIIRAMAFNEETGEMYIGTDKGIQSYRTETTSANDFHKSTVIAFPNPVRPDYRGPIAINGLANEAEVRITDIDGRLVYKTRALGGQAIWDGNNLNGNDVAGGVYLVFSSSSELFNDPDTYVAKILVVR